MAKKVIETVEISYSDAIGEIEKILSEMNSSQVDVDSLAAKVARANELLGICKVKLLKAQKEVEKILKPEQE